LIVGPEYRFLRSRDRPSPIVNGIAIDERFRKRFNKCGFQELTKYVQTESPIAKRIFRCLDWLLKSRMELSLSASIVKTGIALESLMIISESESLAQTLSERTAFIMSTNPDIRYQISRLIKAFYDARSGVVHGGKKKIKKVSQSLLEAVDRLVILVCLIMAANNMLWETSEALRQWCESQRWGTPSDQVKSPFPNRYLRDALKLYQKESKL